MNGCRSKYSKLAAGGLFLACLAGGPVFAEPTPQPVGPSAAVTAIAESEKPAIRPTFASIPSAPTDVRPFTRWTLAISDLKAVGAQTADEARAGPWTLDGTEAWAAQERSEARPPAPMTAPGGADTAAFVRDMLRRATPPPRAKH